VELVGVDGGARVLGEVEVVDVVAFVLDWSKEAVEVDGEAGVAMLAMGSVDFCVDFFLNQANIDEDDEAEPEF
jgi:hypothetical protein